MARIKGNSLRIKAKANVKENWVEFSPANIEIELNGEKLDLVQEVSLTVNVIDSVPRATITMSVTDLDIDADALLWLKAKVEEKENALR